MTVIVYDLPAETSCMVDVAATDSLGFKVPPGRTNVPHEAGLAAATDVEGVSELVGGE